ncbi:interleukin-1 family member 10-like [Elgaria multicarinata webbii]|uniref:interleukin-1 family member 10-like n=1 Tax=Elgaria multicarinata webbii TaxID=159646 RepID=UPI002FCD2CF0
MATTQQMPECTMRGARKAHFWKCQNRPFQSLQWGDPGFFWVVAMALMGHGRGWKVTFWHFQKWDFPAPPTVHMGVSWVIAMVTTQQKPGLVPFAHNVPHIEKAPRYYKLWDINQKFLYLINNSLVASPSNSAMPDQLMTVLPNNALDPKKPPIFIGLKGGQPTLSCVKSDDGQPQLKLEERHIMDLYKNPEKQSSFTFYSKTDGSSETCSFESAEFPGWFLSTSSELNKPVGLSRPGFSENTLFYFETKSDSVVGALF